MYANAKQALQGLKHKRTGEVLPTKNVARNTKLIYFADELVGLKLHDTIIAMYREDDVILDTREAMIRGGQGGHHGNGWFTNVTFDRINSFTPARTFRSGGLTFISDPAAGTAKLYTHGVRISPNGSCENNLLPALERHLIRLASGWHRRAKSFAGRAVTRWSKWGERTECCRTDDSNEHLVKHVEANDPVVPYPVWLAAESGQRNGLVGAELKAAMREQVTQCINDLLPEAIRLAEPNFPFPQATPRRTR